MKTLNSYYLESATKSKTRLDIINASIEVFSEKGIDGASLSDIADRCNTTLRNLYRYYSSKEYLVMDVAYILFSKWGKTNVEDREAKSLAIDNMENFLNVMYIKNYNNPYMRKINKFIMYFDLYLTTINPEHEAYKKYVEVYREDLIGDNRDDTTILLEKGILDGSIKLKLEEVECYCNFIHNSLMSILLRSTIKEEENPVINITVLEKQIELIIENLKGK